MRPYKIQVQFSFLENPDQTNLPSDSDPHKNALKNIFERKVKTEYSCIVPIKSVTIFDFINSLFQIVKTGDRKMKIFNHRAVFQKNGSNKKKFSRADSFPLFFILIHHRNPEFPVHPQKSTVRCMIHPTREN
jgi:hypothetical protein